MPNDPYRVTSIGPMSSVDRAHASLVRPDDVHRLEPSQDSSVNSPPNGPRDLLNTPAVTYVQFRLDRTTGQVVMHVLDNETGEIVRQIPSDEMLQLAIELQKYLDHPLRRPHGYGGE